MTEPCDLDAVTARRLIGEKKLSASELLESCLARIDAVDPAVNAMVARDDDRARATARAADAATMRGDDLPALHGLPIGIKDLEDVAGLRTTYGSALYRDFVPKEDQQIVASVRKAGAIIAGKTNTPEWGAGANTRNAVYGATGNPFDPSKSAAGSSGGSGVALLLHLHSAYSLTVMNRKARPAAYQSRRDYLAANFASRTMRWSGIIVLAFIGFHLGNLTFGSG